LRKVADVDTSSQRQQQASADERAEHPELSNPLSPPPAAKFVRPHHHDIESPLERKRATTAERVAVMREHLEINMSRVDARRAAEAEADVAACQERREQVLREFGGAEDEKSPAAAPPDRGPSFFFGGSSLHSLTPPPALAWRLDTRWAGLAGGQPAPNTPAADAMRWGHSLGMRADTAEAEEGHGTRRGSSQRLLQRSWSAASSMHLNHSLRTMPRGSHHVDLKRLERSPGRQVQLSRSSSSLLAAGGGAGGGGTVSVAASGLSPALYASRAFGPHAEVPPSALAPSAFAAVKGRGTKSSHRSPQSVQDPHSEDAQHDPQWPAISSCSSLHASSPSLLSSGLLHSAGLPRGGVGSAHALRAEAPHPLLQVTVNRVPGVPTPDQAISVYERAQRRRNELYREAANAREAAARAAEDAQYMNAIHAHRRRRLEAMAAGHVRLGALEKVHPNVYWPAPSREVH